MESRGTKAWVPVGGVTPAFPAQHFAGATPAFPAMRFLFPTRSVCHGEWAEFTPNLSLQSSDAKTVSLLPGRLHSPVSIQGDCWG